MRVDPAGRSGWKQKMHNDSPEVLDKRNEQEPSFVRKLLSTSPTIESVLRQYRGAGPGFDALRIGLALAILSYHAVLLSYDKTTLAFVNQTFHIFIIALVPMFFALSGFLVTGSALRTRSVRVFLTYRGLRIFPALAVEVTLCALVLGPIVTSVPLSTYFTDKHFFAYFGNVVGMVRMTLPGVFLDNPHPNVVNGSLWTLQPEFYCYLIMAGLMLTSIVFSRFWFTLGFAISTVALTMLNVLYGYGTPGDLFPPNVILYYFFVGIAFFHWKDRIVVHPALFAASALLAYFTLPLQGFSYLAALPITYCTVYIGMLAIPRIPLLQAGDYSYGIYLFNFPIQQSLVYAFPSLREWWMLLAAAVPLTVLFAALSWHWIEKPSLGLKKRFLPQTKAPTMTPVARPAAR
ncbi:MAG: acyltransferase [Burkholderiales bacterium]|nr:acyltransferase [Burkholderiales bacterium]